MLPASIGAIMKTLIYYAVGLGIFYLACEAFHIVFGLFAKVTG
jgi:hypothetical protein